MKGLKGKGKMGGTNGPGTPDGHCCTWLIWEEDGPTLPCPSHMHLGNVSETLGWKTLKNATVPREGIANISEMHPKSPISAGYAKSLPNSAGLFFPFSTLAPLLIRTSFPAQVVIPGLQFQPWKARSQRCKLINPTISLLFPSL